MDFEPHSYQLDLIEHFVEHKRCAGWASLGSGKTVSTLTAIDRMHLMGLTAPVLILAPKLVANITWPDEVKKWSHLSGMTIQPIGGTEKQKIKALNTDAQVYTTNYEQIPWLVKHYGARWPFGLTVLDESTRVKSFRLRGGGQRAAALGKVAHTGIKRMIQLTGTPATNGYVDLWGQMWMLDGGQRLGRTIGQYKERFFRPSYNGYGVEIMPGAEKQIQNVLSDICLTIDAVKHFGIDDPVVRNVFVELPDKARQLYDEMEELFYIEIKEAEGKQPKAVEALNSAAKSQKLLQLTAGAVYVDPDEDEDTPKTREWREIHDVKIQALDSIVEEANGMPVLVAYNFKSDASRLLKAFKGSVQLTQENSSEVIRDWNAGKIPVLLAHPATASHGINLQHGGNIMVFFGVNWNLEHRLQIIERIGPVRQKQAGYKRPVYIYNILARDTIDEVVLERVETKRDVQDLLLEAMERRGK